MKSVTNTEYFCGFAVVAKSPSLHEVLHVLQNPFWQKASEVLLNSVGLDQCSRGSGDVLM